MGSPSSREMSLKPGRYPIRLEQGVGWSRRMTWRTAGVVTPLSGYGGVLQVRHPDNEGEYVLTIDNDELGGIVLTDEAPNISLDITPEQVAALVALNMTKSTYRLVLTPPEGFGQSFVLLKDDLELDLW